MGRTSGTQRSGAVVAVDDLVGRIEIRPHPRRPSVRLLDVAGRAYGAVDLDDPARLELEYLSQLAALLTTVLPAGPAHLVHLGGGAFALPRALAARRPELTQVVVEQSARMIGLAQDELGLRPTPALRVVHDDARALLRACADGSADAIVGDAFVGSETPRHLATAEFAADVARVLRPRGHYVLNLIDAPPWPLLSAHAATVRTALPHLVALAAPAVADLRDRGNVLLVGARRPLHRATLEQRLGGGPRGLAVVATRRLAALAAGTRPRHDDDG